jgi:CTP:molybdopterin cytidylyltransferase MocA
LSSSAGLHALVLAAGAASRFGSPKALARLDASTLIELALRRARAVVGEDFTVVLGAQADAIRATLDLRESQIVIHAAWDRGLAESLKYGVSHVPAESSAALIMLMDQPAVSTADLNTLIAAWQARPETAAAAYYAGDIGAPCILPRTLFARLRELHGDRGAKPLLHRLAEVTRVPMPSAEFDIDTREDLARAAALAPVKDI